MNVEGTANILDAARACGVRRVVAIGSSEEYGQIDAGLSRLREDAPLRPVTPYGASKVAASFLTLQAWLGAGLETVRVRAFSHTGPGQSDRFVVPALAHRIVVAERERARTIPIGAREPVRDLSDVRDIVRARTDSSSSAASRARPTTCAAARACRSARSPTDSSRGPVAASTSSSTPRSCARSRSRVSSAIPTKLIAATGWSPRYTLDETLDAVLRRRAYARSGFLTVEPAEQRRDRTRVVPQSVRTVRHDPQVDRVAAADGEPARVVDRHDVVGAAVHEEPRARRDALRRPRSDRDSRSRASTLRDRSENRRCATRRCAARTRGTIRGSRTHVRNDAGAANVAMPRTRSSSAATTMASVPPSRKPAIHTPVMSVRACSTSTAARTSASQPSIEKSPSDGPVPRKVNVSPAQPDSRAIRSHNV